VAISASADIEALAVSLLARLFPVAKGMRLIGVTVSSLDRLPSQAEREKFSSRSYKGLPREDAKASEKCSIVRTPRRARDDLERRREQGWARRAL
jgi:hypothetical protein